MLKTEIRFSQKNRSTVFSSQPDSNFYPAIDLRFYFQNTIMIASENRSGKSRIDFFLQTGFHFS